MHAKTRFTLFSLVFATAACRVAAEQTFLVTPQTLSGWTVAGADIGTLTGASQLVLPAGAQLARTFNTTNLALSLDGQPMFSSDPANWSVLEIGPAALIFDRVGNEGHLKLVLGEKEPISLPFVFQLDESGHSQEPVRLTFTFNADEVAVNTQGRTVVFPGEPVVGSTLEVVVSAGGGSDLSIGALDVVLPGIDPSTNASDQGSANSKASDASQSKPAAGIFKSAPGASVLPVNASNGASDAPSASTATAPAAQKISLVVFTPPSFRHGRADALRAAATTVNSQK